MRWLDKLERKFGKFAIGNMITFIVMMNAFVYIIVAMGGQGAYYNKLLLIPDLVMQGEVWRLFTFVFIPPMVTPFWIIFTLYFYYLAGKGLEQAWGSFKFNIYYLFGVLATIAISFITKGAANSAYINLSLFLAFARIYPDYEILLFFVLPIKVKYMAYLNWIYIIYALVTASNWNIRLIAIAPVINFLIFFGKELIQQWFFRSKALNNKARFVSKTINKSSSIHKCTVCGITEKDDPDMEFRYCSKCNGHYEYCSEHLSDHEHIK